MRILLADKLPDSARVRLAATDAAVRLEPKLSGDALVARLREFDPNVLIVRSTRVTAEHVDAAPSLALVVRAGAGVNTIDLDATASRAIYVANCPGKNADAVAELTLGLLLAIDRHIPAAAHDLRQGTWNKAEYSKAGGLKGKVLGLIGLGRIGTEVAVRALAFGMKVVAWSRSLTPERAAELGVVYCSTPEEVARRGHVVSVHLALTPGTADFVGDSIFDAMTPGAIFLNTSRAEVVDGKALLAALDDKGIRAGLDVFPDEPSAKQGTIDDAVARHPNVVGTHHIGASTEQAQQAVADEACRVVESYMATGTVPNVVNLAARSAADHVLVVRHRDRVGVLAAVLGVLRENAINVQEMENTIFAGRKAASARIMVHGDPSPALAGLRANEDIFSVAVFERNR